MNILRFILTFYKVIYGNMEGRDNLNSEFREALESVVEEATQDIVDIHRNETDEIEYLNPRQLNALILRIRSGNIPNIEPHETVRYTYKCWYNDEPIVYINAHQYFVIQQIIRIRIAEGEIPAESFSDNIEETPFNEEEIAIPEQVVEDAHNEIPTNSATLLVDEATSRFSSAIWYDKIKEKTVVLAGVGGIGSYVGFLLARMKVASLFIFDPDVVETANMSGQLYSSTDVGRFKVSALSDMIRRYAEYNSVFAISERFTSENEAADIMICGFDNMKSRAVFFYKWKAHVLAKPEEERGGCLFIDGRLAAEEFQVLCIKGNDEYNINRYDKDFLFSDREADETICSYKQTTFMANMIASVMVNLFVNFVANQCEPLIDRDLPFFTTYSAETMFYKTEA